METEEFNNDELCDPKINPNLAKAINNIWGKKLTPEKLKTRLNKYLKPENCDQLSPSSYYGKYLAISALQIVAGHRQPRGCLGQSK